MAAGQSRLTHFTGDTSAVIDADIWTYYVRLRQFGQVLEALKDKCAAYIRHREPVRERLIEIAKSDHALFQSWITEAHPRITWKLGTPLIGGSRNGFRIAIEWTEAQVAVLEDESEIRLNYLDSDIPFSALTGHWKAVWKIDIFERDMRDLAHNWLKAQLMFP